MTYVELKPLDIIFDGKTIIVQIFPSECAQYLIPYELFNHKIELFKKYSDQNKLIGKKFKVHCVEAFNGHEVKIHEISPFEPEYCGDSLWETLVVTEVDTMSLMRNDRHRRGNN